MGLDREAQFVESSVRMRLKLVATYLAVILVFVVVQLSLTDFPHNIHADSRDVPVWKILAVVGEVASCYVAAAYFIYRAINTWRANQTPLPDAWVWVRTKIRKGAMAKFTALCGLLLGLWILCFLTYALIELAFFTS